MNLDLRLAPGHTSSEYRKSLRAEWFGAVVLSVGVLLAIGGALSSALVSGGVGVGLAAVGAYLVAHPAAAYASSRGAVKAASEAARGEIEAAPLRPRASISVAHQAPRGI